MCVCVWNVFSVVLLIFFINHIILLDGAFLYTHTNKPRMDYFFLKIYVLNCDELKSLTIDE